MGRDHFKCSMAGLAVGACLYSLTAYPTEARALTLSARTSSAIDAAMDKAIGTGWVAGGVVEVAEGGHVLLSKAYGMSDLERGIAASTGDVYRIGSLTKQFTAAAALLLVEDGRLTLDARVAEVLPGFPANDATTIRQLLNHTSGIAEYQEASDFHTRGKWLPLTTNELLDLVYSARPLHKFSAGADWQYSSSNYVLIGAIIERISGQPLAAFFKERLFQPLGMRDTALDNARELVPHRASGYDRIAVETSGYQPARTISMTVPFAAGAMRSTAADLVKWNEALAHGRVLNASSYREMTTAAKLSNGQYPVRVRPDGSKSEIRYGFGQFLSDEASEPKVSHDGGIDGFTSRLSYYPKADVSVVVLVNTSPSGHLPFAAISEAVEAALHTSAAASQIP